MSDFLKPEDVPKDYSEVEMVLDEEQMRTILSLIPEGATELPDEVQYLLKQTAMRMILFQVSSQYPDQVRELLGEEQVNEEGHIISLLTATEILPEFYEFVCSNVIGMVPELEFEITGLGDA